MKLRFTANWRMRGELSFLHSEERRKAAGTDEKDREKNEDDE